MANNLVTAEADRLLNASLNGTAYTAPTTPMKLALATTASSASAAGTEVTGGSYARQTIAFTTSAGSGVSNSGAVTYTNMPAATTTHVDVYDSNGSPRRCWFGALTASKTTALGDTLSFAIGAVTVVLT
jgi:hypothetical protein